MSREESVADFEVRIDGSPLKPEEKVLVHLVSVERGLKMPDKIELILSDRDEYWSKKPPTFGAKLEVDMGYVGKLKPVGAGTLAYTEFIRNRAGAHEFRIVAYGPRYILQRGVTSKSFQDSSVGDNVVQSASGLPPQVTISDASLKQPHLLQANQASEQVLEEWASRLGLVVIEKGNEIKAIKPEFATPGPTYEFEHDLREFKVEVNTFNQVSEVVVSAEDPKKKKVTLGKANKSHVFDKLKGTTLGSEIAEKAFGKVTIEVTDQPINDQQEADRLAIAILNDRMFQFVQGNGTARGDATLQPAGTVTLERLGGRLSGPYLVTRVNHVYHTKEGFRTFFECCRPAIGDKSATSTKRGAPPAPSGPDQPPQVPAPVPPKPSPTPDPSPSPAPQPTPPPAPVPAPPPPAPPTPPAPVPVKPVVPAPLPKPTPVTPPKPPAPPSPQPAPAPAPKPKEEPEPKKDNCPPWPACHFTWQQDANPNKPLTYHFKLPDKGPNGENLAFIDWDVVHPTHPERNQSLHQKRAPMISFDSRVVYTINCRVRLQGHTDCQYSMSVTLNAGSSKSGKSPAATKGPYAAPKGTLK